jgi:hypothetical protein
VKAILNQIKQFGKEKSNKKCVGKDECPYGNPLITDINLS